MSLSTYALGQRAIGGFKFHTADWNTTNTGTALGSGDGIEWLYKGTPKTKVIWTDNTRSTGGAAIQYKREKVQEEFDGSFSVNAGFRLNQRLVAAVYGTDTTTLISGTAYSHLMTFNSIMGGVNGNLGWTDNLNLHDCAMFRVESIDFDWAENKIGELTVNGFGKREILDGSGSNTLATVNANCTLPTQNTTRYQFLSSAQARVRLALAASGALGAAADYTATDAIYPNHIKMSIKRKYMRRHTNLNNPYMDEPVGSDWYEISGTLDLPIMEYAALYTNLIPGTEHKMDIRFLGSQIAVTGQYDTWTWEHPSVTIDTSGLPSLDTPDLLKVSIPWKASTATTAPTGMAFTTPRLTIIDATSASHLTNGV